VIARVLEQAGLSTTSISLVREHTEKIKPPRALWVPFPFGSALGRPNDPELQHKVLRAALDLLEEPAGPVLRDFPDVEGIGEPAAPVQASAIEPSSAPLDAALETTQMRHYYEQWLERNGGRTAVGLSGIPPARFRGIIRFLEAFAAGQEAAPPKAAENGGDLRLDIFIRRAVDDLKAMYYEARMAMAPDASGEEIARWFWGDTALAQLLRQVKARMEASDDPQMKSAAYGIAR
jgi:hypothetical protein